jgi:peptide/nickel transport system substrate-binding protein
MVLRPNSLKGVTADKRVRQAMNLALDRELIVKEIMGNYALVPNGQLYVPSTFAYDTTMKDEYNLEKAQALVKEAGAEGKEVHIIGISANRWLKDREIQEAFTQMINKTGLKVKLSLLEQGEWLKAGRDVSENPPMDVWFSSAGNDLVDPDRILSAYGKTGGRLSLYSNPEMDKMLDAQRAELNPDKRATILKQIAKKFQDDAVMIPIAQQNWIYGISPKLKFKPLPNGQLPANRMTLS